MVVGGAERDWAEDSTRHHHKITKQGEISYRVMVVGEGGGGGGQRGIGQRAEQDITTRSQCRERLPEEW